MSQIEYLTHRRAGPSRPSFAVLAVVLVTVRVRARVFYEVPRRLVAELTRAVIAFPSIKTVDPQSLLRAPAIDEVDRLDFAEAYLVAQAEAAGVGTALSFDKRINRVAGAQRREP